MGNLAKGIKETLPDFQKFLLERSLAPEKNIPFLAYWVSRFLTFGRQKDISTDYYNESAVIEFLDMLRTDEKILDWQPRQADDALKLYYFHYLGKTRSALPGALKQEHVERAEKPSRCPFQRKSLTDDIPSFLTGLPAGRQATAGWCQALRRQHDQAQ